MRIKSELEIISPASEENEKGALQSDEKINTGKPIFKAKSFNTFAQSCPIILNFCNNALAKIMRKSGAITVNICVIWLYYLFDRRFRKYFNHEFEPIR